MPELDGLTDAETETLASKILTAKPLGELECDIASDIWGLHDSAQLQ